MTPEGAARVEAERVMASVFDGYETRPLMERCVVWTHEGPPLLPPAYNDIHQIFQTPDHFVLFTELATNPPRILALDEGPGIPDAIRSFGGDSRARWEGDTLVVETDQFIARRNYRGSNRHRHVEERFTMVDADLIRYEFMVTDPTTWTSPWGGEVPMVRIEGPHVRVRLPRGQPRRPATSSRSTATWNGRRPRRRPGGAAGRPRDGSRRRGAHVLRAAASGESGGRGRATVGKSSAGGR